MHSCMLTHGICVHVPTWVTGGWCDPGAGGGQWRLHPPQPGVPAGPACVELRVVGQGVHSRHRQDCAVSDPTDCMPRGLVLDLQGMPPSTV
eukprot:scaffold289190_cov21-Tisochrysis_lutea.AAC.1